MRDSTEMEQHQDYVLRTIEERHVRLVRLWFTDVLGQLKSVAISPVDLAGAFEEGVQFDGSAIDGFSRMQESDVLAIPDAASFQLMHWAEGGEVTARVFCDLVNLDGSPFEGDPRQVLKRNLRRAGDAGYQFMCAPEVEFFYFESDDTSRVRKPIDNASYFDLTTFDASSDIRRGTIGRLEATGIPVEYSFHEDAPSQHEIDLQHTDGLTMADNVMTLRLDRPRGRARARRARHVHAEADRRRAGLGHAHAHVARARRRERLLRPRRRVPAVDGRPVSSSPGCCATRPRSPR